MTREPLRPEQLMVVTGGVTPDRALTAARWLSVAVVSSIFGSALWSAKSKPPQQQVQP